MTITYIITPDDILALNHYYTQKHPSTQKHLHRLRIVYTLILGMSIFFFSFLFNDYQFSPALLVVALVASAILYALIPSIQHVFTRLSTTQAIRAGRYSGILGEHSLAVTPEALVTQSSKGESKFLWNAFEHVGATATHLFLFINTAAALIVPRHAFSDEASYTALLQAAKQ